MIICALKISNNYIMGSSASFLKIYTVNIFLVTVVTTIPTHFNLLATAFVRNEIASIGVVVILLVWLCP